MAVLRLLDTSRTGRAWRAVRDDPLAAASMTIPVNRVKLMAFAFGAMVAALAGTVFAAQQISVFPTDFDTAYLILIYAGLILGGAGSIAGAVVGGAGRDDHLRRPAAQPDRRRLPVLRPDPADAAGPAAAVAQARPRCSRRTVALGLRRARDRGRDLGQPRWPAARSPAG